MNRRIRTVAAGALPIFVVLSFVWAVFPYTPMLVYALSAAASLFGGALAVRWTDANSHPLVVSGASTSFGAALGYESHLIAGMTISTLRFRLAATGDLIHPLTLSLWFDRAAGIVIGNVTSWAHWGFITAFAIVGAVGGGAELLRR